MDEPANLLLFVVTDRFTLRGRGLVLWPGVPVDLVRPRMRVRIERPDGSFVVVEASTEHASGFSSRAFAERWAKGPRPVCVALAADEVPLGSQVWDADTG